MNRQSDIFLNIITLFVPRPILNVNTKYLKLFLVFFKIETILFLNFILLVMRFFAQRCGQLKLQDYIYTFIYKKE